MSTFERLRLGLKFKQAGKPIPPQILERPRTFNLDTSKQLAEHKSIEKNRKRNMKKLVYNPNDMQAEPDARKLKGVLSMYGLVTVNQQLVNRGKVFPRLLLTESEATEESENTANLRSLNAQM